MTFSALVDRQSLPLIATMRIEMDILPPRYRDPQRIGRGGMGEIYRAIDDTLGRAVAVKLLAERYAEDESVRGRFTREALAAARLSGEPNTVTIFDVGEWNGRPFIVMEYLAGGSLDEVLHREGAQEPAAALAWLEQAARALDAAHANGVVHRDVKPGNLLFDREGEVHVADFGIASAAGMESLTATGTILGTAGYLSPEQAQGERATPASDCYAFAVLAFELLTGTRPYEGDTPTAEATAHVHAEIPSASERLPELPPEVDTVFRRGLAKDPAARYPSCSELVLALREALAEAAGATAKHVLRSSPARPQLRAHPRRAWPFALALLLGAALVGGGLAALLAMDGEETAGPRSQTVVKTVTTPGETQEVTVTEEAAPPPPPPPAAEGASGAELNDQGFALMQAGDYAGALPLLEQAVAELSGSGELVEAYASYNLAFTRLQLGSCEQVFELLDRSQSLQRPRKEIDKARKQAEKRCA